MGHLDQNTYHFNLYWKLCIVFLFQNVFQKIQQCLQSATLGLTASVQTDRSERTFSTDTWSLLSDLSTLLWVASFLAFNLLSCLPEKCYSEKKNSYTFMGDGAPTSENVRLVCE